MSQSADYLYALELQKRLNKGLESDEDVEVKLQPVSKPIKLKCSNPSSNLDEDYLNRTQNLVHPQWETLDPTPDVNTLFGAFDGKFFQSRLKCVSLEWSKRMFSCAGICYSRSNRYGMDITIRLSEPLLKLRPRKDLIETLLHEMIHAYCFVLNIREGNGGHGPNFKKIMYSINKVAGTNITVYHTFHDEVEVYKQHWWRCNGICQNRSPFFGFVKRTSNRAPSFNDQWWTAHHNSCGGTFMKIKGPEPNKKQTKNNGNTAVVASGDLRKFFSPTNTTNGSTGASKRPNNEHDFVSSIAGSDMGGFIKGHVGGTLLFNSKTQHPSTNATTGVRAKPPHPNTAIASAFPPSSYPGLSTDPFSTKSHTNLRNVMSFGDLISKKTGSSSLPPEVVWGNAAGTAASGKSSITATVDRSLLRDIWSKRFPDDRAGGKSNSGSRGNGGDFEGPFNKKPRLPDDRDDLPPLDAVMRQHARLDVDKPSCSSLEGKQTRNWIILDDDVMLRNEPVDIITLSDNEDSDGDVRLTVDMPKTMTSAERQKAIKREILDDSTDLISNDDIILIDDDFDDDEELRNITAAVQLADTSIIDEFFGDDELMREFTRENAVRAAGRDVLSAQQDIITCPVCLEKLQRCVLSEHLDGCMGIAVKVPRPTFAIKKLLTTPKPKSGKTTQRRSHPARDILRRAGYNERDMRHLNVTSEDSSAASSQLIDRTVSKSTTSTSFHVDDDDEMWHRQRNLNKTTHECPVCYEDVEEVDMNEHLDECLRHQKKAKNAAKALKSMKRGQAVKDPSL